MINYLTARIFLRHLSYAKQRVSATSKSLLSTGFSKTMGQLAEDELIYLTDQGYMFPSRG
jgi:hypothetical protein